MRSRGNEGQRHGQQESRNETADEVIAEISEEGFPKQFPGVEREKALQGREEDGQKHQPDRQAEQL